MTTTTNITNIAHKLDLTAYAGDFINDYDMDAVHNDYVSMLNRDLPDGITICNNGDVIAQVELADQARDIDWDDLTNERSVEEIFERHEHRTAVVDPQDLRDVGDAHNSTEACIRIVGARGDELDVVAYEPADDETAAWASVQCRLAEANYQVAGEWATDANHVARVAVTRV